MFKALYDMWGFNEKIFLYINHITNLGYLPHIFYYISYLFEITKFPIYYFSILIYLIIKTKNNHLSYEEFRFEIIKLTKLGFNYFFIVIIFAFMKYTCNMQRPFCSNINYSTILNTELERCLSSFPSAHTGIALIVCSYLWNNNIFPRKYLRIILVVTFILACISRISLAMHFPQDIISSIVLTSLIIYVVNKLLNLNLIVNLLNQISKMIYFNIKSIS